MFAATVASDSARTSAHRAGACRCAQNQIAATPAAGHTRLRLPASITVRRPATVAIAKATANIAVRASDLR